MDEKTMLKKCLGALMGTATGDALGAGFEGGYANTPERIEAAIEDCDILQYTDDTHMMIGVAQSLIAKKGIDSEHMAQTFKSNYQAEPWRGYGPGPPRLFQAMAGGYSYQEAAATLYPGGSYGNGSAMRVAPVGVLYFDDRERLKEAAYLTSSVTHTHVLGKEGAALQALAVGYAMGLKPDDRLDTEKFLSFLYGMTGQREYKEKLRAMASLLPWADVREVISRLGNGIEALNSVPTAIYSFLRFSGSYHDAVLYTVSLGGDTDTIAAMAGAVAGAYLGVDAIPWQWRLKLENAAYIGELAQALWGIRKETR